MLTISIEIELAWGRHDKGEWEICSKNRSMEEIYLEKLLDTCDVHGIPITFDIVGHLLLKECGGTHAGGHPKGWFKNDPGSNAKDHPLFYWPEVVDIIKSRKTNHEIATHTFSHILCDQAAEETIIWELKKCKRIHNKVGIDDPVSIVPPRNRPIKNNLLRSVGLRRIRSPIRRYDSYSGRFLHLASSVFTSYPSFKNKYNEGIMKCPAMPFPTLTSILLPDGQKTPLAISRQIPLSMRKKMHRSYLDSALYSAVHKHGTVHLWTHLHNFANEAQWSCIRPFISRAGGLKNSKNLEVRTMSELSA